VTTAVSFLGRDLMFINMCIAVSFLGIPLMQKAIIIRHQRGEKYNTGQGEYTSIFLRMS
jgi:hypothetical protein